jgi:hypothetical protein
MHALGALAAGTPCPMLHCRAVSQCNAKLTNDVSDSRGGSSRVGMAMI